MKKVAIVGAGLVGASTAYFLSRAGCRVTIFDREKIAAQQCSKANGGQISVCNAETWNTWSNIFKGIKWMFQADAPLLIRPSPSIDKLNWIAGFLKNTMNGTQQQNTVDTIKLGKRSSYLYDRVIQKEGLKFDQSKCGMLHVYSDYEAFARAKKTAQFFERYGVEWSELSPTEIVQRDPKMSTFSGLVGGYLTSADWVGDAHKYANALITVCRKKYGLIERYGCEVVAIDDGKVSWVSDAHPAFERFDAVVICAGYEIMKWSKRFSDGLNVYPVKGYSITINDAVDAPRVSLLDDSKKIVCSNLGGRLRVAGTAELTGVDLTVRKDRIAPLVSWVKQNFPTVDVNNRSDWACLRPMNSNMMPIVKASRENKVFYHGGHGHLGWTLSAGTTEQLIQLMGAKLVL